MGLLDSMFLGRSALATAIVEGTPLDRTLAHVALDSLKHTGYTLTPAEDRAPRRDVRPSRQDISMMVRGRSHDWSKTFQFLPRGTNVPPDAAPFWRGAFGLETIGGASVTYSYARVPPSLGYIITGGEPTPMAQEKLVGMVVQEMLVNLQQGAEPTVQFSGAASEAIRAHGTALIGTGGTSATQNVVAGQAIRMKVGSIVEVVGVAVNLRVVSRNVAANTVTFDSSIATGGGGQIIRPYTPWSESTTNQGGEPIASWRGSISIGGVGTYLITGAKIRLANNWFLRRHQFSQTYVDATPGIQEITGSLMFDAGADEAVLLAMAEEEPASTPGTVNPVASILTVGDAALGGQCVMSMPNLMMMWGAYKIPEAAQATFEVPFHAMSTRTAGVPNSDAFSAVWS